MEYNIYMTNDCNLSCEYCSVMFDCKKHNIPVVPQYSHAELARFIRNTSEQFNDRKVMLFFFGGEPTLEYGRVLELATYLEKELRDLVFKPILHTNGLLLGDIPDALLEKLSLIMLSINYERIPKHHLYDSYFSTVMNNARSVKRRSGVPIVARPTITEETSLFTEVMMVDRFFDKVHWQLENCLKFDDAETFAATYSYEVELLFEMWLDHLKKGVMPQYVPFMGVLKFLLFHDRDDNRFVCGYDKHMLFVQTNGNCYACCDSVPNGVHRIGDIYNGIQYQNIRLTDLFCGDCEYRRLCMGCCGRMHKEFSREHCEDYCRMNKRMFDLFLDNRELLQSLVEKHPHFKEDIFHWILDVMEYTP